MSFKLYDRVKELSHTTGTGNFILSGAVKGFIDFQSVYNVDDYFFYGITDGSKFEIGSGQYFVEDQEHKIRRFPFDQNLVNFNVGIKEVYVTYPSTHNVHNGSGLFTFDTPQQSGISFWGSNNILDYDHNLIWDKNNKRIGLNTKNPKYAIDVGGNATESLIQVSGIVIGESGIFFPPQNNNDSSYIGGSQLVHFIPNSLGNSNTEAIFDLSGDVQNILSLKEQNAGLVFAGPPSGCSPPCSPALPSFRPLVLEDIPDLSEAINTVSDIAQYGYDSSGVLRSDLTTVSGIAQYGYDSSGVLRFDLTTVSGIAQYGYDSSGVLRSDINQIISTVGSITAGEGIVVNSIFNARLSIDQNNPMLNSVNTDVFLIPYNGNQIALYDTDKWKIFSLNAPASIGISQVQTTGNHDVFAYVNNNMIDFEIVSWANDFTRNVALQQFDGILVDSVNTKKRYIGSIVIEENSNVSDHYSKRFVYNHYNQIEKTLIRTSDYEWTPPLNTWRAIDALLPQPEQIRISLIASSGCDLASLQFHCNYFKTNTATIYYNIAITKSPFTSPIGMDINLPQPDHYYANNAHVFLTDADNNINSIFTTFTELPSEGLNRYLVTNYSNSNQITLRFKNDATLVNNVRSSMGGLFGKWRC
jgi:hypothetical protein